MKTPILIIIPILNYTKGKYKISQSLLPHLWRGLGVRINEINYFIFAFGIRATTTLSKAVISFVSSGKKSLIIEIFPQERHCFKDKEYNKNTSIKVRLVRVDLPNGEVEFLMTLLLDSQK